MVRTIVRGCMDLRIAVRRAIKASGLKPYAWAVRAKIPKSTYRSLMLTGTCAGATLAALQRAGVVVADKKLIASLSAA